MTNNESIGKQAGLCGDDDDDDNDDAGATPTKGYQIRHAAQSTMEINH